MVRVVGEAPEAVKKTTCRHCAAQLEYVPAEVKEHLGGYVLRRRRGRQEVDQLPALRA